MNADHTDELTVRSERYVRKIEKYQRQLEAAYAAHEEQKALHQEAKAQQREELNSTMSNSVLFEDYLKRADKQTADLVKKLGDVQAQNLELREKINALRRESNKAIRHLEKQAVAVREHEAEKLRQRDLAKALNDERESVGHELGKLRRREKEAQREFIVSMELARQIHQNKAAAEGKRLSEMRKSRKQAKRQVNQRAAQGPAGRKAAAGTPPAGPGSGSRIGESGAMTTKVTVLTNANKLRFASTDTRVKQQSEAVAKLRQLTGLQSVDEIAEEYTRLGDQHVRAMKFYNLVHEENMMLREEKARLEDAATVVRQNEERHARGKAVISKLKADIQQTNREDKAQQALLAKQYKVLEMAKCVVFRCFLVVGCNDPELGEQVEAQGITDENLLHVLGIIEHRVHQYVLKQGTAVGARLQEKKHDRVMCIVPPNAHHDDEDSDDDVVEPVSHKQVLEELLQHGVDEATGGRPQALP